jgi:hypothetical protein
LERFQEEKFPIGTCEFVPNDRQYDLSILNGAKEKVISIEFRLDKTFLTTQDLKNIFDDLRNNYNVPIGFVVSLDSVSSILKYVDSDDIPQNNFVYSVSPKDAKGNKLTFLRHFPANEPNDASFETITDTNVQMSFTDSNQGSTNESEGSFQKEPKPKRIGLDWNANQNLILIFISISDLNRMSSMDEFLHKFPLFGNGL